MFMFLKQIDKIYVKKNLFNTKKNKEMYSN